MKNFVIGLFKTLWTVVNVFVWCAALIKVYELWTGTVLTQTYKKFNEHCTVEKDKDIEPITFDED